MTITSWILHTIRNVSDKTQSLYSVSFFRKLHRLWDNVGKIVKPEKLQKTIRYGTKTRFICRITKARIQTHTHNNSYLLLWTAIRIFCSSKTVQREPTFVFPCQHWTLLSCCHFLLVKNNKKGRYSIAIMVMRTRQNVTLYVPRLSCVFHVSFPVNLTDFRDTKKRRASDTVLTLHVSFVTCNNKHNRITHSYTTI